MTQYALVISGTVQNIGAWDGIAQVPGGTFVPMPTTGYVPNIGDTYNGTTFTAAPPPAAVVPATVTAAQLKMALQAAGILTVVTAAVNASPDPLVGIYWANASSFDRADPRVVALGAAVGQTAAQMDAVFMAATQYPSV